MMDAVIVILVANLFERIVGAPKADLEGPLVICFLGAVAAIKGAPAARGEDRVVRQSLLALEVPRLLPIAFEVEIGVRRLGDLPGHDAVGVRDPRPALR